ncbi:MAG: hypothetical protein AAGA30_08535 [Planctomycetota bacterium]
MKNFITTQWCLCVFLLFSAGCFTGDDNSAEDASSVEQNKESTEEDLGTGFLPVFDNEYPQNSISNRMEKNYSRIHGTLSDDQLTNFGSAGLDIYQPKGMDRPEKFTGWVHPEKGVSFLVLTNPFSMRRTTSQIVSDSIRNGNTSIIFTKEMEVSGQEGVFYLTKEPFGGKTITKYILSFGNDDFSWILTSTFAPEYEAEFGEELLKMMFNVKVSEELRLPPGEDVNFTIQPNRLTITDGFIDKMVFTKSGVFPTETVTEPIFQAGRGIINFDVKDKEGFARALISPTPAFVVSIISSTNPVTIDGLDGFEYVSIGEDTVSGEPLRMFSTILFDGADGYVMHGWVSSDTDQNYIGDFRDLAKSFRRKSKINETSE